MCTLPKGHHEETLCKDSRTRNISQIGAGSLLSRQVASFATRARINLKPMSFQPQPGATTYAPLPQLHSSFKVQDPKDFNERVKNSKVPVIVDFFATWCNPCRTLGPRLESVIAEKNGKILLAKVDIDENTDIALDYDVGSVPALIAIKDGKIQERLVGLQDTDKLRKFVDKVVASAATGTSK
ncbi:unnamed protein product [Timema podura]|uniref:Thioredoxin domain-containing protein n=1 Tax=Timema podura TaxID=61482 RepID=A0ABN7NG09_TIMPD|nr:unnamed protein product [Timema podura]